VRFPRWDNYPDGVAEVREHVESTVCAHAAVIYPELRLPTLVEYGPAGALSHEPLEFVERESVIEVRRLCWS